MIRCPNCGEQFADSGLAYCDQCGARLAPSGLLMLGPSLGGGLAEDAPSAPARTHVLDAPAGGIPRGGSLPEEPARFIPFASRRALGFDR